MSKEEPSVSTPAEEHIEKRKKKKKRGSQADKSELRHVNTGDSEEVNTNRDSKIDGVKKKSSTKLKANGSEEASSHSEAKEKRSRSTAREPSGSDTGEREGEQSSEKEGKKKEKRKRKESEDVLQGASTERKKKRKREDTEKVEGADDAPEDQTQRSKKSKNETGLPDPAEEASLSAQAQKALSYAFVQFRKPSKWKFQKARQNWIIRNWATENIPDSQMPLVLRYLSNVQGNIRENLTKICVSIISTETPAGLSVVTESNDNQNENEMTQRTNITANLMKLERAKALLAALENKAGFD
ncbi:hypothetical protein EV360DRAFT_78865 [Lentinula raphanica]|nr:hypothetical protein EV360DRAFT_78865 [Lentinula raphanica]